MFLLETYIIRQAIRLEDGVCIDVKLFAQVGICQSLRRLSRNKLEPF
jgi:hypothetical protein